jgi:hypothetical protein
MENKEFDEVIGSSQAPYTNGLARTGALATASYGIRHPSLPNYLALTGGSTFGIKSNCLTCHVRARNLVDQLEASGTSWKAYMEGMPSACFRGSSKGLYLKRHNPFIYYDNVASSRRRCGKVVPFTQLDRDISHDSLPSFIWITPDACNDMHDCAVDRGDEWLSKVIPRLLPALGSNGALFLTWDEGASTRGCCRVARGGRIPTIVAGPAARAGARSSIAIDHYSVLRTIDKAIGARPLRLAGCSCTRSMNALLDHAPRLR